MHEAPTIPTSYIMSKDGIISPSISQMSTKQTWSFTRYSEVKPNNIYCFRNPVVKFRKEMNLLSV